MTRAATILRKGLFTLAMALSLGFGASQALAAPPGGASAARLCEPLQCWRSCLALGYQYGACSAGAPEVCDCWHE
ncbi:MAG TPA: hypothetical protein VF615_14760 [Longimicrobiaceae bacterium]|jgi:hypothetical protein